MLCEVLRIVENSSQVLKHLMFMNMSFVHLYIVHSHFQWHSQGKIQGNALILLTKEREVGYNPGCFEITRGKL